MLWTADTHAPVDLGVPLSHRGQIVGLGRHDGVLKPFVMTPLP